MAAICNELRADLIFGTIDYYLPRTCRLQLQTFSHHRPRFSDIATLPGIPIIELNQNLQYFNIVDHMSADAIGYYYFILYSIANLYRHCVLNLSLQPLNGAEPST